MKRGGARAHTNVDRVVLAERPDAMRGSNDAGLFASDEPMLFLVDGNNLLWRAAHGYPAPFQAKDGRDLTTLFRFVTHLRRALGTYGLFAECVVCFDGTDAWAERLEVDPTYKSNRSYEDKDLSFMGWLPEIRTALECAGVTTLEVDDKESDDVIATLATRSAHRPVRILSTDRDFYQLIDTTTLVVDPRRGRLVGEADVIARFGVTPVQWCDFRTLTGDPSDGIPGLPGVGAAKAALMLAGGRTLDDLRHDAVASIVDAWDDLMRSRDLIRCDTQVETGFEPSGTPTGRLPSASVVCAELGLVDRR